MKRLFSTLAVVILAVSAVSCRKAEEPAPPPVPESQSTEAQPEPEPSPEPTPEPTPEPVNKDAVVTVLGYHRFEDPPKDGLAISTKEFEAQMQALKDAGVEVISMEDFLAWRRGEKSIPEKAAVITIDDGYNCAYHKAWPILQKFNYPFTFYVYTNYISAGGRSITWEQLKEMRDAGVDIASHTVSHDNLVRPRRAKGVPYDEWLWDELKGSKDTLEQNLGIRVTTLAYPYGIHNENVMQKGLEAGYEALFTVMGQKVRHDSQASALGRYIIVSDNPAVFRSSIAFGGGTTGVPASTAPPASAAMLTQPMQGEVIPNPYPEIRANLAVFGNIDPRSVEMRLSGFGIVPAKYDPESKTISYQCTRRIREKTCTVLISARAGGKRVETQWTFHVDPKAAPAEAQPVEAQTPAQPAPSEAAQPST